MKAAAANLKKRLEIVYLFEHYVLIDTVIDFMKERECLKWILEAVCVKIWDEKNDEIFRNEEVSPVGIYNDVVYISRTLFLICYQNVYKLLYKLSRRDVQGLPWFARLASPKYTFL